MTAAPRVDYLDRLRPPPYKPRMRSGPLAPLVLALALALGVSACGGENLDLCEDCEGPTATATATPSPTATPATPTPILTP